MGLCYGELKFKKRNCVLVYFAENKKMSEVFNHVHQNNFDDQKIVKMRDEKRQASE